MAYMLDLFALYYGLFRARYFIGNIPHEYLGGFSQVHIVLFIQANNFLPVLHSLGAIPAKYAFGVSFGLFQNFYNLKAVKVVDICEGKNGGILEENMV